MTYYVIEYRKTEKNYNRMSEKAIDMMESGAELTDEQLEALEHDSLLMEECRDIFIAANVLTPSPQDTEQQLERFHRRHRSRRSRLLIYKVCAGLAVAAAFVGAVFLLMPGNEQMPLNQALVFEADETEANPQLMDRQGRVIPLNIYTDKVAACDPIVVAQKRTDDAAGLVEMTDTVTLLMPKGHACRIDLADGTVVYMHPGSKLNYPSAFGDESRCVRLEGEAYFVVAKDSRRPFIVSTSNSQTTVVGTEFNIRAYKNNEERIVLVNGKIHLKSIIGSAQEFDVLPGQEIAINAQGEASVMEADTMQYTAWRDGYHYYDEATVADILRQIGISYNVSIECYNRSVLSYRMHYVIRRDCSLEEAVESLNKMGKMRVEIIDGKVVVK